MMLHSSLFVFNLWLTSRPDSARLLLWKMNDLCSLDRIVEFIAIVLPKVLPSTTLSDVYWQH